MLVGKNYDEASYLVSIDTEDCKLVVTKLSPKAYNVAILLQYDELTCYMFANIIQAGAISSHVHDLC